MAYRGRLIFPFVATIHRLDTSSTAAAGYDPDFRAPKHSYPGGVGVRASTRRELAPVELRCQYESGRWEEQRQVASGNTPDTEITLVFHMLDLELAGLVDISSGTPLIRENDRLSKITRAADGSLVQLVQEPGLFAVKPEIGGLGLRSGYRNLLIVGFADRPQGLTGAP